MALGVYTSQELKNLINTGIIQNAFIENIQPSTLDFSISDEAYRMKGIFLPRPNEKVSEMLKNASIEKVSLDNPLKCQEVYLIRLNERLALPNYLYAYANNKSSSGRINLQARLIVDNTPSFDFIPKGYHGTTWVLLSPQSFNIKLYPNDTINQVLFKNSETQLSTEEYLTLSHEKQLLYSPQKEPIILDRPQIWPPNSLTLSINLDLDIFGYKCKPSSNKTLDFRRRNYNSRDFFEPLYKNEKKEVLLKRGEFYILSTYEHIRIPENYAVEMIAYDLFKGEFRTHYAGFFDPGFGYGNGTIKGTPAVLEILSNDNDFYLRHRQPICKFTYERLTQTPSFVYGTTQAKSHYQKQRGPQLSKHFL